MRPNEEYLKAMAGEGPSPIYSDDRLSTNARLLKKIHDQIGGPISDSGIRSSNRILPLNNTELATSQIVETVGIPEYVTEENISEYESFGINKSGWYVFARINAESDVTVTEHFTISGVDGYEKPSIGDTYVNVAIAFGTGPESKKVEINWGDTYDAFVFKATDLAVRNLDYRVTYYVYDIKDFTEVEYKLTTDTKFVDGTKYYKLVNGEYVIQDTVAGEEIPADTYYVHAKMIFKGFTRNVSYSSDEIDCPVEIHLPNIDGQGFGAWFEIQTVFTGAYSVTFVPPEGVKMSASTVPAPSKGINVINAQYHEKSNTWFMNNTVWKLAN